MLTAAPESPLAERSRVHGSSQAHSALGPLARGIAVVIVIAALACAGACASKPSTGGGGGSATLVKNEIVARGSGVTAELVRVEYGPQSVQVRVELRNAGDAPLSLTREGILLAYDGLEYPASAAGTPAPDPLEVSPEHTEALDAVFDLGRPLGGDARLVLRTLRRGERWLDPLELTVPATPPALGEDAPEPPNK